MQSILDKSKLTMPIHRSDLNHCLSYTAKTGLYNKLKETNELTVTLSLRDIKILEEGLGSYRKEIDEFSKHQEEHPDPNLDWENVRMLELASISSIQTKLEKAQEPLFDILSQHDILLMCRLDEHELDTFVWYVCLMRENIKRNINN